MTNVGIAGIGFMGWIHYLAYKNVKGVRVAAICTRSEKKLAGDWRGIKGNFGPPGERIDVSDLSTYRSIDELLADPKIDLLDNCLPPHLHADVSIRALQTGKHVFCEKPMALNTADCKRMVAAAAKSGRPLMIGHVLPFHREYAYARKVIDSGKYGKLIGGNFIRVISDPLWLPDFYDADRVGGPLIDLHVHDAHLIRMLFGMPTSLISHGRMRGDVVQYCQTAFRFDDPRYVVTATSGVINQQGRPFTHGFEIHLERATLQYEYAAFADAEELMPVKLLADNGKVIRPQLPPAGPTAAFEAEINDVLKSIRAGAPSSTLSGDLARDAIILCHKQTESVWQGRAVKV
jgi:predicted dehydrogenase